MTKNRLIVYTQNLLLFALSLLLVLVVLEAALRTGWFDGDENPMPVWIPPDIQAEDDAINSRNFHRAEGNWNFFNNEEDIFERSDSSYKYRRKPPGTIRIAVLGDSVVWGHGLDFEDIWSIRLKRKIQAKYDNVELYSWGRSGWDTADYFLFLAELTSYLDTMGEDLGLDLLVVSHFSNDPNLWLERPKGLYWQEAAVLKPVKFLLPYSFSFMTSYINRFLTQHFSGSLGLRNGNEDNYTDGNLEVYRQLLSDFSEYCKLKGIKLIFALVPKNTVKQYEEEFQKVIPLLEAADIEYMNLYPPMIKKFKDSNLRTLGANLANTHPGKPLTELFSQEVMEHLESKGYLSGGLRTVGGTPSAADENELLTRLLKLRERRGLIIGYYVLSHIKDYRYGYIAAKSGYKSTTRRVEKPLH